LLGEGSLMLELEECLFALEGGFGGEDVFLREGGLGGFHACDGLLSNADVGFESGDFEERIAHQEADGCHEDNQ
jgi:hypothetical protein